MSIEMAMSVEMANRERFLSIFKEKITREGADKLLEYLSEKSDFFFAPASTRYHGAYEGGLLEHSLNVYECLCDILSRPRMKEVYGLEYSEESIAIVALLHDVCKVNFYKVGSRNVKDENGKILSYKDPRVAKARSKTYEGVAKAMAEQWAGEAL